MINAAGAALWTKYEGVKLKAYKCPAGKWTIGRGHTHGVKPGDVLTIAQEQGLFQKDAAEWEDAVLAILKRTPNENQLAAFICFAFNIGLEAFRTSTAVKAFERGDDVAASRAFGLFIKITDPVTKQKVTSNGLVARRAAESALFLAPVSGVFEPMPQQVESERPMSASTINRASVVAGGTASVAAITESINAVSNLKYSVESLGTWLVPALLIVTVVAVGYIIWQRFQQRSGGIA